MNPNMGKLLNMRNLQQRLLLVAFFSRLTGSTIIKSQKDAMEYLKQFGYLPSEGDVTSFRLPVADSGLKDNRMFTEGLTTFQLFSGLEQSGKLDERTVITMNMPRCGMAERMELRENKNINMSILSHKIKIPKRKGWRASRIYYRIANLPLLSEIDPDVVKHEIRRAFRMWENVANIDIMEGNPEHHAEIDINFWSGEHGDGSAFGQDALGNIVAHAFFPDHRHFEGDIHFDDERQWTAFNTSGVNLFQVAAHEIGHALGLDHSRFPDSVMHMLVQSDLNNNFKLHEDDIQGIQKLYGPRRNMPNTRLPNRIMKPNSFNSENRFPLKETTGPQSKNINANMVITVPTKGSDPDKDPSFEKSLSNFWTCFSLSQKSNDNSRATNCYKENVLRLLYSLNIV